VEDLGFSLTLQCTICGTYRQGPIAKEIRANPNTTQVRAAFSGLRTRHSRMWKMRWGVSFERSDQRFTKPGHCCHW